MCLCSKFILNIKFGIYLSDKFHLNLKLCQHQFLTELVILRLDMITKFVRLYLRNLGVVFMLFFFNLLVCFPLGNFSMYNAYSYLENLWVCWQACLLQAYARTGVNKIRGEYCDKLCLGYAASLQFRSKGLCADQLKIAVAVYTSNFFS